MIDKACIHTWVLGRNKSRQTFVWNPHEKPSREFKNILTKPICSTEARTLLKKACCTKGVPRSDCTHSANSGMVSWARNGSSVAWLKMASPTLPVCTHKRGVTKLMHNQTNKHMNQQENARINKRKHPKAQRIFFSRTRCASRIKMWRFGSALHQSIVALAQPLTQCVPIGASR